MAVLPHNSFTCHSLFQCTAKVAVLLQEKEPERGRQYLPCWLLGKCFLHCDSKIIRLKTIVDLLQVTCNSDAEKKNKIKCRQGKFPLFFMPIFFF